MEEILKWQSTHYLFIGDQVVFYHLGFKHEGYLVGFDLDVNPIKPIIRYTSFLGNNKAKCLSRNKRLFCPITDFIE